MRSAAATPPSCSLLASIGARIMTARSMRGGRSWAERRQGRECRVMEHAPPRSPDRADSLDGLAYTVWLPDNLGGADTRGERSRPVPPPPWPGMVILHGAGS